MKLNLPGVLMLFAGAIFIYAGRKKKDPRDVILEAIGSKRRVGQPVTIPDTGVTPAPAAPSVPDGGQWVSV